MEINFWNKIPPKKGLQKKFVTALLIAGLSPGIVALYATYLSSNKILTHSIGTNFQEIATAVAKKVEMIIEHDLENAETIALSPTIRAWVKKEKTGKKNNLESEAFLNNGTQAQKIPPSNRAETGFAASHNNPVAQYLRDWEYQHRNKVVFSDIMVVNPMGLLVASSRELPINSFSHTQWFKSSFQNGKGENYLSNIYYNDNKRNYFYDIAVPIRGSLDKEVLGILKMGIRRDKLLKTIMEVRIGETGHAMLVSSLGNPLICPILPPTDHLINAPLMKQIAQVRPSWAVAEDDAHGGEQSIVGFAPVQIPSTLNALSLGKNSWYAFIRQHPDETYAPIYNLLFKVGLLGFGLVFVISFFGFLAGKRIVKPIGELKRRAQSIGQASYEMATQEGSQFPNMKLKERIDIKTGDEIEQLSQAINQMSLALEENFETIKKQERELSQKEKLATIGQLLAGLTHDLKNPLGVIRSSAQILMNPTKPEAVKKEVGQYVIEEVDRLTHRINDFLRFARPRPLHQRPVSIEKIIKNTLWQVSSQRDFLDKIKIIKEISPNIPPVNVDPDQINGVLFNLLNNAREAMPMGGVLTLRAEQKGNHQIILSVQDTGEGIPSENLEKIFEPFFTGKTYGVGLGLTNVKHLVEENGGQVVVESEPGLGSIFTLIFPISQNPIEEGS